MTPNVHRVRVQSFSGKQRATTLMYVCMYAMIALCGWRGKAGSSKGLWTVAVELHFQSTFSFIRLVFERIVRSKLHI